jgi:hypothetical protein
MVGRPSMNPEGTKADSCFSEVLPLANSAGGHRLGVNGLAVDSHNSILYAHSPHSCHFRGIADGN